MSEPEKPAFTETLERARDLALRMRERDAQKARELSDKLKAAGLTRLVSPAERAHREERLRIAGVPIEEHIQPHVIADDLESTPALEIVQPVIAMRSHGYRLSMTVGLLGEPGRGKTVAMAAVIAALGGRYVKLERACQLMKRGRQKDEHEWEAMLGAAVLCVDELGVERDPVDGVMTLHEIIDERQGGKITVLGSNLDERKLRSRYDGRTIDRLRSQWRCAELTGPSYRVRRPWAEMLRMNERDLDEQLIEERYRRARVLWVAKGAPHEKLVELMWARDAGIALARAAARQERA